MTSDIHLVILIFIWLSLCQEGDRSSLPTWSWGLVETTAGNSCVKSQPSGVSYARGWSGGYSG